MSKTGLNKGPLSGMTGFGRADGALHGWTWSVEARSVNGRSLETRFRGPNGFDSLERLAKAASQARFQRGQVSVGVQARKETAGDALVRINQEALDRYTALAQQLMAQGAAAPTADGLLALRGVIEVAEEGVADTIAAVREVMQSAAHPAVDLSVPLVVEAGAGATWAQAH